MAEERRTKPVDVFDHTNAMGVGMGVIIMTPFVIAMSIAIAIAIHASAGWWSLLMIPLTVIGLISMSLAMYHYESTWTREEAAERGREWEWDQSV